MEIKVIYMKVCLICNQSLYDKQCAICNNYYLCFTNELLQIENEEYRCAIAIGDQPLITYFKCLLKFKSFRTYYRFFNLRLFL